MNIDEVKVEYIIDDLLDGSDSSHPQEREHEKVRKDLGRWSIYESQKYIDTLRMNEHPKYLVRELRMVMPNRSESQIRAHHQKMLRKYGSVGNILALAGREENFKLVEMAQSLDNSLDHFRRLSSKLEAALARELKEDQEELLL